ncbi:MAG TPA: heat-inducible transcriptional repressor HrcA [Anaerolineaceae bacterium]|nr:heat-inducible transcriptional repressor HrcA [Anaerolineaceae bacterium]
MNELTERQKLILTLVIHEYAESAAPVGSKHLVKRYRLNMSSATIRNEMAALTELGYLRQPHTSAGRVPTEDGYRFFVGRLVHSTDLPVTTRRMISHQFYQSRHDVDQWMRLAASVLAHQSQQASLVTAPHSDRSFLKHVELIATRGRQVLMVLVLMGGEVRQRFVTLDEPVPQEQLSVAADRITHTFQGKHLDEIRALRSQLSGLDADIVAWIITEFQQAEQLVAGEVYLDGLANVLAQPEFAGSEDARRALRVLEERSMLQDLLARTVLNESLGGIQVLIGGEGTWEDLRQFSIVLARYGSPGLATGTLGVLGPMRMPYGHTISVVRYLSGLLSEMVSETLIDETLDSADEVNE